MKTKTDYQELFWIYNGLLESYGDKMVSKYIITGQEDWSECMNDSERKEYKSIERKWKYYDKRVQKLDK